MSSPLRPSTAGLTVLCLLRAAPLHPYGIQRLIKAWGKDEVVNVGPRANLYKTIKRLHEAGLVAVRATERTQQYPERTVYELTDEGQATGLRWLTDMLRTARNEYPEFPAALSFAMALHPDAVVTVLSERLEQQRARLAELDEQLRTHAGALPRITLIESEYQRDVLQAEVRWLTSIVGDLKSGKLSWDPDKLAAQAYDAISQAAGT